MKLVIVDDEAPARDRLRQLVSDMDEYEIVGEAGNGAEALEVIARSQPDIVLLDIRMPGMDGIETARHLDALEHPPAIVFATAYDEYAIDAFEARAVGYVLKPVRRERLASALGQAARLSRGTIAEFAAAGRLDDRRRQICVQHLGELRLIALESIACFTADQKYTRITTAERDYLIDDSLKQLEAEFADDFVRVHRSALVALRYIEALEKSPDGEVSVRLRGNIAELAEPLTVSRRHVAAVRRRLRDDARKR